MMKRLLSILIVLLFAAFGLVLGMRQIADQVKAVIAGTN